MLELRDTVEIACAPATVWRVLEDVARWPLWTPTVTAARALSSGAFGVGRRYALKQPAQREAVWEVTDIEAGRFFAWERVGARLHYRAEHALSRSDTGTRSLLRLQVRGASTALAKPFLAPVFSMALRLENRGLKRFCEGIEAAKR